MFFKKLNATIFSLILIFSMPGYALAYSDYIIPGGENIGIEINTTGIIVVGTYDINGKNTVKESGIIVGDIITEVNNKKVSTIDELASIISNSKDSVEIKYQRDGQEYKTNLSIFKEDGISKTGLYVKDSITGIGTLSYIDPNTLIYGALGHEVIESNTGQMLEVKDGKIVESRVINVERSSSGNPGSKNAELNYNSKIGVIEENTKNGIFGKITEAIPNKKTYKVANVQDIQIGPAKILTVIDGVEVDEYTINILKIDKKEKGNKGILFEVTDEELLNKTGGIVQGMSGSPIIQGEYIIGAVTHVVVDNPKKGYGIFITNMLKEGEN